MNSAYHLPANGYCRFRGEYKLANWAGSNDKVGFGIQDLAACASCKVDTFVQKYGLGDHAPLRCGFFNRMRIDLTM